MWALCLLLPIILFVNASQTTCPGEWVEKDTPRSFNGLKKPWTEYHSKAELLSSMCPVETLYENCFYNGIIDRANKLLYRYWELKESTSAEKPCSSFNSVNFLSFMRNRNLYFTGDSSARQIWQYLTCTLLNDVTVPPEDVNVDFQFYNDFGYVNSTCPFGAPHCMLTKYGYVYFAEYNVKILVRYEVAYTRGRLLQYIRDAEMTSRDVLIYNFGGSYNSEGQYEGALKQFVSDIIDIRDKKEQGEDASLLLKKGLFFIDTLPTHHPRPDVPNGYYVSKYAGDWCEPLHQSAEYHRSVDWKNTLPEKIIATAPAHIKIIPVANALYSQFDGHLAGDSKMTKLDHADCTIYCSSAPVFPYIVTEIWNFLNHNLRI